MAIQIRFYLYWHSICISIRRNKLRKFYSEHPDGLKIILHDSLRKVNIEGCCCKELQMKIVEGSLLQSISLYQLLPIQENFDLRECQSPVNWELVNMKYLVVFFLLLYRSEERRVGKEDLSPAPTKRRNFLKQEHSYLIFYSHKIFILYKHKIFNVLYFLIYISHIFQYNIR